MLHRVVAVNKHRDPNICVTLRGEDGKRRRKLVPYFRPYFYVPAEIPGEEEFVALDGVPVRKVRFSTTAAQREGAKDWPKTYEHDVPYGQRWMIDWQVFGFVDDDLRPVDDHPTIHLKKMYWDIEVAEPTKHEALDVKATGRIVSITTFEGSTYHTFYWSKTKAKTHRTTMKGYTGEWPWVIHEFPTEERLLEAFARYVKDEDPDLLVGFNSEKYDWPMTVNRAALKKVKINSMSPTGWLTDRDCPGRQLADLWALYDWSRLVKERYTTLAAISKKHGVEVDKTAQGSVYELWKKGTAGDAEASMELMVYNARDVELNWFIDQKERLTDFALALQEMTGVDGVMDVTKASVVADVLCLREAFLMGRPLPSRTDDDAEDYEGGEVLSPRANGVVRDVAVYDFSRLYPSLIVALNISPEVRLNSLVPWADESYNIYEFDRKTTGLMTNVVKRAFNLRDYCEAQAEKTDDLDAKVQWEMRAQATKKIINGIYGALGYTKFRLYEKEVAETVTGAGRFLITNVDAKLIQYGERPIYGDTDSVFVQTENVARTTPLVLKAVDETCSAMGIPPLKIKHEKTYWSLLILKDAKKRYTGYVVFKDGEWLPEPKRETKGFEEKRSDSSEITARVQADVFDMLLREEPRERVLTHVIDAIRGIASGKLPLTECAPMPQLSNNPEAYDSTFLPATASKYSNKWLGTDFRKGDRISVVYVTSVPKGCPRTHAVAVDPNGKIPDGVNVDWQMMAQKAVGEKMAKLFSAIGWEHEAARCRNPFDRLIFEF